MSSRSLLHGVIPPVLLLSALAMVLLAFGMLAFGQPEESAQLIGAHSAGDEDLTEVLKTDLSHRKLVFTVQVTCLFAGGGLATWLAFALMRDSAGK